MIFKKRFSNQENLRLTLSPNSICRTLSGDLCPCNRLLPYRYLKYSVWFCLSFKIIFTSVAETTMNCFCGSFAQVSWEAFYFSLTGLVQILLSSLKGWQDVVSDVTETGGKGDRERSQPNVAGNPSPSTLTRPGYCQHLSEKSCSQAGWHHFL